MTLSRLVSGMRAAGHEVEVVRPRQASESGTAAKVPGEFLVPGFPLPFYASLRFGWPASGRLRQRWRHWRPDVVHVATEGPLGQAARWAAKGLGIPVTSSFHTNFHHYGLHYGLKVLQRAGLAYLRGFHNATRCTMVPTSEMRAELAAVGFKRLEVISRGVDTTLFDPVRRSAALRAEWGAEADTPVAIYVGRLAAEKNLALAVRAFVEMRAREPQARFVLVGDGPERAILARRYPDFHYAGMRRGEDLAAHYASADIFLFPSVTETFGNVITESMASGLVVVSYDYAAAREHVRHEVNGLVAPLHDEEKWLATAGAALRGRSRWPEWRRAARETTHAITWPAIVARFEATLERARVE